MQGRSEVDPRSTLNRLGRELSGLWTGAESIEISAAGHTARKQAKLLRIGAAVAARGQ